MVETDSLCCVYHGFPARKAGVCTVDTSHAVGDHAQ